ncbi:MAG: hypothetical protein EBZ36_04430, partial [Acidobacteria bacterium]|nr:hypothetical protein [Acidobacteriota bacterium]
MLSEYRRRFIDYNTSVREDDLAFHRGIARSRERLAIFRDQRDLFTRAKVEELRQGRQEAPHRERRSYDRWLVLAIDGHLAAAAHETEVEIERMIGDPRVQAEPALIDDLFEERTARMGRALRELGYSGVVGARSELDGVDYHSLAGEAARLLRATEQAARRVLERVLRRELGRSLGEATRGDLARLRELPAGVKSLRSVTRLARQTELFNGLGFRTDQQPGVGYFEVAVRPGGRSGPGEWPDDLMVWALRVPGAISTGLLPFDGRYGERVFWQTAGATQLAAWTSAELPVEYQYQLGAADSALPLASGMLFDHLLQEEGWLSGCFGQMEAGSFREGVAALRMLEIRQAAAQLIYEIEYFGGELGGELGGRAAERYCEQLGAALLVRIDPGDHHRGIGRIRGFGSCPAVSPTGASPLAAASLLRA